VIDGQSARRGVSIDGTGITGVPTITLEGLTVRRGRFEYNGSGIYIRNGKVVLRQNQVLNNVAPYGYGGGGIYATGSIITLDSNTIQGNTATAGGYGGGISVDGIATLIGNKIQSNAAYSGGGIYVSGTAILSDNTIQGNSAGSGGGVALMGNATLNGNTIRGNTGDGGYVNGTITLSGNIIQGNSGDGVFVNGGTVNARNDIITGNGEGVHLSGGNLIARHWTLADNYRYAVVSNGGSAVLTNTIAYHHIMAAFYGPNITADHTLFYRNGAPVCQNGATCTNDVIGDPKFVNPAAGDYHIGPDSAAIDAGVNANVTDDIDGGPRPVGIGYDIGADEYDAEPPPPTGGPRYDPSMDVNKDGKIDVIDIQRVARLWGTSQWGTEQ
jgi:hypothetical protein